MCVTKPLVSPSANTSSTERTHDPDPELEWVRNLKATRSSVPEMSARGGVAEVLPRVVPIMEEMAGDLGTVATQATPTVSAGQSALTTCFLIELLLP